MEKITRLTVKIPRCVNKASSAENAAQASQAQLNQELMSIFKQQFGSQQDITAALTEAMKPMLEAGPGQKGFTPAEEAAMRTSASDNIANSYKNAKQAMGESLAARGGGNTFLPSGAEAQLNEGLASEGAAQNAQVQNQITQQNYQAGLQNFYRAASALSGNAALMNPLGYANAADSSGQSAFNDAYQISQQNSGWANTLGGMIGGAAGSFLGGPLAAKVL